MTNRIQRLEIHERLLDPASTELWISVYPERRTASTEVRGRLTGPRCHYASTVEVAYPLRPLPRRPEGLSGLVHRVSIPEASFWEPESPFLYQGSVELWEDGQRVDQASVSLGLRAVNIGMKGIRVNGRRFTMQGVRAEQLNAETAAELRARHINTLLAPVHASNVSLWVDADRLGFFVLGRIGNDPDSWQQALALGEHPSSFGWLVEPAPELGELLQAHPNQIVGMHANHPAAVVPGIRFLACDRSALPALSEIALPKLLLEQEPDSDHLAQFAEVLGWIQG